MLCEAPRLVGVCSCSRRKRTQGFPPPRSSHPGPHHSLTPGALVLPHLSGAYKSLGAPAHVQTLQKTPEATLPQTSLSSAAPVAPQPCSQHPPWRSVSVRWATVRPGNPEHRDPSPAPPDTRPPALWADTTLFLTEPPPCPAGCCSLESEWRYTETSWGRILAAVVLVGPGTPGSPNRAQLLNALKTEQEHAGGSRHGGPQEPGRSAPRDPTASSPVL